MKITDKTTLEEFWTIMENIEENGWLDDFIKKKRKKGRKGNDGGTSVQRIDFLFGLLLNKNLLEKYAKRYVEDRKKGSKSDKKNTVLRNSYEYITDVKSSRKDYFQQDQNLNEKSTIEDVRDKICEILAGKDEKIEAMEILINELKKEAKVLDDTVNDTSSKENHVLNNKYVQLLRSNKQIILHGAPGTGKTYSALNKVAEDLGIKDNKQIRINMVQFHPSYDYTDFIDGIKPNLCGKGIEYTLKNGCFKSFCRSAGVLERIMSAKEDINDENIEKFLTGQNQEIIDYWIRQIGFNTELKKSVEADNDSNTELVKSIEAYNKDKNIECINEVIKNLPEFLFIIDEINRAEISKVFGEVMFCMDADYRGDKGKISTQYSSCATEDTFFVNVEEDKFYIPSNVYIIGTMNNIDRSVEIFDFAMRRRFAWYEVKADEVMDTVLKAMGVDKKLGENYKGYYEKIKSLNKAIIEKLNLTSHYHIGPVYFAKINLYIDNENYKIALKEVWDNHICQILSEYARNKRDGEEIIEEIGKEFCREEQKDTQDEGKSHDI